MCDRNAILEDMLRGWNDPLPGECRTALGDALDNFSCRQLTKMQRAGVRFWPERFGVPPEYHTYVAWEGDSPPPSVTWIERPPGGGSFRPASYAAVIRTVCLDPNRAASSFVITHELAHAWDDVRYDPDSRAPRLDRLRPPQREREFQRLHRQYGAQTYYHSQTLRPRGRRHSLRQMWDNWKDTIRGDTRLSFASISSREHVLSKVMEFYAEGYATFHDRSTNIHNQTLLYMYAPELYEYLEAETREYGVPTGPNHQAVRAMAACMRAGRECPALTAEP